MTDSLPVTLYGAHVADLGRTSDGLAIGPIPAYFRAEIGTPGAAT